MLTHGEWHGAFSAKTAVAVWRYCPARVSCIIDRDHVGPDAGARFSADPAHPDRKRRPMTPVFASLEEALGHLDEPPTRFLIGIAPEGGGLDGSWRADIETAIDAGIPVLAGLHRFLADDPEIAARAKKNAVPLVDLRRTPEPPVAASGVGRRNPVPVVLLVGTDCRSGKMTTTVELVDAAKRMGLRAAWVATGQTGRLLSPDAGAPIDRTVSDFTAGETERQVMAAARLDDAFGPTADTPDIIFVEGQGALSHPAYSGVSLGLLHGSRPDLIVLCHVWDRTEKVYKTDGEAFYILPLDEEVELNLMLAKPVHPTRLAGVAIATPGIPEDEYVEATRRVEALLGVPCVDPVRVSAKLFVERIVEMIGETPRGKRVPKLRYGKATGIQA